MDKWGLSEIEATAFLYIATSDTAISSEAFAAEMGVDQSVAEVILEELADVGLIYKTEARIVLSEIGEYLFSTCCSNR